MDTGDLHGAGVSYAIGKLTGAVHALTFGTLMAVSAIGNYISAMSLPVVRRMIREERQGYKYPNWVWDVEEQQRQQFGSGNGRKVRE